MLNSSLKHFEKPDSIQLHKLYSISMESHRLQKLSVQSSTSGAQTDNNGDKHAVQLCVIRQTFVHHKIHLRTYFLVFRRLGLRYSEYSSTPYSSKYSSNINMEECSALNFVIFCTRAICELSLEKWWKCVRSLEALLSMKLHNGTPLCSWGFASASAYLEKRLLNF